MSKNQYLHGFAEKEQERLNSQAVFLAHFLHNDLKVMEGEKFLEIGCGVGSQTRLLLQKYPSITITGVELNPDQFKKASANLKEEMSTGRVRLLEENAAQLSLASNSFDTVYICWVLEHASDPLAILKEAFRVLKPGGKIYCREVMNFSFYHWPESEVLNTYWNQLNQLQVKMGGDPFVGAKLGSCLKTAGFQNVVTEAVSIQCDQRDVAQKQEFLNYWKELLLSAQESLLAHGKIETQTISLVESAMNELMENTNSVFFYSPMKAFAQKL